MRLKPAQLVVIAIALGAGGLAAMLMGGRRPEPVVVQQQAPASDLRTVEVLVARGDVPMGKVLSEADLEWRRWPEEGAAQHFMVRRPGDGANAAMQEALGSIARVAFAPGEPIRQSRLIKGTRGFMSAILTPGMRAIATPIDDASRGAGFFVLPNDRVDVLLARRSAPAAAQADGMTHQISTILTNIRVLAIDQQVEEKDGKQFITGRSATLELTPPQAETIALARELGSLSLALRSLADAAAPTLAGENEGDTIFGSQGNRMTIVRFGVPSSTAGR